MNTKNIALGYKRGGEKKLVGIVEVKTGEKVALLTLTEDGKTFKSGKTSIKVPLSEMPKRPALKPNQSTPKEYRVRMNQDGDAVEALTPVRGLYPMKAISLGKKESEDGDPAPYEKVWNEGKSNENRYLEFFVVYEIADGAFKGVQMPAYQLHYKFEEDPQEEGFTRFTGDPSNPKATRLHQLVEWGQAHGGIWGEPIRWSDDGNILPELEERILDADVVVNGFVDKGYIQSIQPSEDYETEDVEDDDAAAVDEMLDRDDEEEEEVKPVKIAHKAAPKSKKLSPAKVKKVLDAVGDEDDDL